MAKLQKKSLAEHEEILRILKQIWGYSGFRPLQEEIILSVIEGRDTLALMPTGGGKSIAFQVPAIAMDGICLVVTPLISLMKDQVDQLTSRRIKATAIHSGMTRHEIDVTLDNCVFGDYKFLYVSPERLGTEIFRTRVRDMKVNLITVDEAHCISQWGYDFRPSYLEISSLRQVLPGVPVLALTATATREVCRDIQERLSFESDNLLSMSFDRENLAYIVRRTENRMEEVIRISGSLEGSGIVYVRNRRKCREVAEALQASGITSGHYHAGLNQETREDRQSAWTAGNFRVMVATNAFGMGIDKPDVRYVIHMSLPDSPEAYFQEAGRAGRDGGKAWAVLLSSPSDKAESVRRIRTNFPPVPKIKEIYLALCNYLQIPLGSGKGQQYDFRMGEFLNRYRFDAQTTHSALSILAREGYLAITDAINHPSRVKFRMERDSLYQFQVRNSEFDGFIKLLLRSYSGLFSQYVKIEESTLSRRSGLPGEKVYGYLKNLSDMQVIHYIPRKRDPVVTFLEERLDVKNLLVSPERYRFRKERYETRVKEMLRYSTSESVCRNQFLLSYFGQLDQPRCGRCDVCIAEKRRHAEPGLENRIREAIRASLRKKPMTLEELVDVSEFEPEQILPLLERWMEEETIERGKDLRLNWKGS